MLIFPCVYTFKGWLHPLAIVCIKCLNKLSFIIFWVYGLLVTPAAKFKFKRVVGCMWFVVERPPVQDFGTLSQESEIIQSTSAGRSRPLGGTPRPKRRSSAGGGGSRNRGSSKKQRVEESVTPAQPVII